MICKALTYLWNYIGHGLKGCGHILHGKHESGEHHAWEQHGHETSKGIFS